ncbi:D-arabinono-1,4-lactone oxidase [Streptomyces sp. NPDC051286]|uniref:D-arabinono-1,4-lactone oxidase n=1 Tax=Streptomyces sp. NPDC051286 TaxID=3365647 RepID=UPI00378BD2D1
MHQAVTPSNGDELQSEYFVARHDAAAAVAALDRPRPAVTPVLGAIEEALAPFGARPHWSEVWTTVPKTLRALYGKYADFEKPMARYDPPGTFRNDFLDRHFPQ